jgi:hypothetical protein
MLFAITLATALPVSAQYISGVAIENYSSQLPGSVQPCCDRHVEYMLTGVGLNPNGPDTHTWAPDGNMWLSDANANIAAQFVTFDLGANYDLAATRVWNYNEVNWVARGVYQMRILVSPDNVSYRDLGVYTLDKAPDPASEHRDFSQRILLNVSNVRYVQFDVLSSYGDPIHVGLSKVRFEAAPAATSPVASGLVLHLDASDVDANGSAAGEPGSGTPVSTWFDKSGQSNHGLSAGNPTIVRDVLNGRPVIRFDGGDLYNLPSFAGLGAGEIFAVLRANDYPPPIAQTTGLWDFGTAAAQTHYSWVTPGLLYDSFGTDTRNDVINVLYPLDQWNLYSVRSIPNQWTCWLNGIEQRNRVGNTVAFRADPTIGRSFSGIYFFGDIAEVLMYNRGLAAGERIQVWDYLKRKYNLKSNYNGPKETPPHTDGLTIHLDANTVTGVGSGGVLSVWQDRSGNALRGSAAGDPVLVRGALGGSPAIRFNGNDEYTLGNLAGAFPSGATVFVATTFNDAAYNLFSTLNNDPWWRYHGNGRSYIGAFRNPRAENFADMPTTGNYVYTLESTGNFWQLYQNNAALGSVAAAYNPGNDYRVSGGFGVADKFLNGDIGEVLVYNRALSAEKQADIGAYLNAKYRIASRFSTVPVLLGRVLHLAADAIPNATEGQVLANWVDLAQGITATAAGDPTYHLNKVNGKPVVRFDGVGDTFSVPLVSSNDMSIFVVTKGSNYQSMIRWQPANWLVYPWGNGDLIQTQNGNTGGGINAGLVPDEWNLAAAVIDTGAANGVRTYRNGIQKGVMTYANAWDALTPLWIASINGGGEFLTGDIAEIIIYNRALNDSERQTVERYLMEKYGLDGKGPGGNYMANLELWMRADKGVNVDTGGAILDWEDQSGFNVYAYQDVAANRPLLAVNSQNNLPAVRFSNPSGDLNTADYFKTNGVWPGGREASILIAARSTVDVPAGSNGYQSIVRYQGGPGWLIYPWYNQLIINTDSLTNGVATGLVPLQWNIGGGFYRAATTNGFQTYRDGALVAQKTSQDVFLTADPLLIGACCNGAIINGESPNADVGEIVVYSERLNEAKRTLAENYLSARYNRSLSGQDVYAGDNPGQGDYDFAMAGIGRVGNPIDFGDGANPFGAGVNAISNSEGLILQDAGFLNESGDFLVAGHNGWYNEPTNADLAGTGAQNRWTRLWYLDKTDPSGNGGQVLVRFDFSDGDFSGTRSGSHVLLRRSGTTGNFTTIATGPQVFEDTYTFTVNAASLSDGYYTIAETDSVPPSITLTAGNFTMECGNAYVEPGFTATDNSDGNITGSVVITSSVNVNQTGNYILRYDVTDTAGNAATQRSRTVTVQDTTPPVIGLNGNPTINIECGTGYVDQGATATDACNGNLTSAINVSGATIDASVPGQYFVTYTVSDIAGNPAVPVQRTVNVVDTMPPVITVNGSDMTLECGVSSFTDPGATANDMCAGGVPVTVGGDVVDPDNAGVYVITYDATDGLNAALQQTRTVTVQDTLGPVITLNGSPVDSVVVNQPYVDAGATATDACEGAVAVTVTGLPVNTSSVGTRTIDYNAVDGGGRPAATVTRTVNVVAGNPPVITLNGSATVAVECGGNYTDAGATASDVEDGNVTAGIIVGGDTVDAATPGVYVITFDVTDSSGNPAPQVVRTVTVQDTVAPILSLVGNAIETVECASAYVDDGATATDTCDDDSAVTAAIQVSGLPINTQQKGPHTITYTVSDSEGNAATPITRTVNVVDTTAPVISRNGAAVVQVSCGGSYNDQGASATDSCDSNAAVTASIDVDGLPINTGVPGQYFVRYNVSDSSGNAATEVLRTVNVVDNVAPVINLVGNARLEIVVGGTYNELGASATDGCEGDLPVSIGGDVVDTSNVGSYFVTYDAVDGSGNPAVQVTREVVVTVGQAPFINGQPSDQFVTFGEDAVFEVSAIALAALEYEWQRDGVPLVNGAEYQGVDTPALTVVGAANADEGGYRCRVSSAGASVFSITAALVVQDPGILTQPVGQVVQPGATVNFTVVAAGSGTLTYQWQKNGTPLANGGNVSGASSATLTLSNVQENVDEASYRCVISGGGDPAITSVSATLTVGNPAIVSNPLSQRVPRGATVEFEVEAVGNPPLLYRWRKDGLPMANGGRISGVDTPKLVITNAQETDEGDYVCRVVGQNTVESNPAELIVDGPPIISGIRVLPESGVVAKQGPAAFTVLIDGGAEPFTYQWQKDGVDLADDSRISGATGPTLSIASAELGDAGAYRCVVTNAVSSVTSPARTLSVGLTFLQNLVDATVENGDDFTWGIRVEGGLGPLEFQWVKDDGTKVFQPVTNGGGISGALSDTLEFSPMEFPDAGVYRVDVTDNTDSISTREATLTVVEALPLAENVALLVALAAGLAVLGAAVLRRRGEGEGL